MPSGTARGPVFVVGMWRSGTSLTYALLNQHSQVALMYEPDLFALGTLSLLPHTKNYWFQRWNFWNGALDRHGIGMDGTVSAARDFNRTAEEVYREYARRKQAVIWGEKSPNYYDGLLRLSKRCPNARFVIVWRHPKEIYRSILQAARTSPWFARKGMMYRALLGYRKLKREYDRLLASGIPVHPLRYEDLIEDPERTLREACEFLQIPFEAKMVSLNGADRSAIFSGDHHALVKGSGIVSRNSKADNLPPRIQRKIDRYLTLWEEESRGKWPGYVPSQESVRPGKPAIWERFFDSVVYQGFRAFDKFTAAVYCFIPLWILREYRAMKRKRGKAGANRDAGHRVPEGPLGATLEADSGSKS